MDIGNKWRKRIKCVYEIKKEQNVWMRLKKVVGHYLKTKMMQNEWDGPNNNWCKMSLMDQMTIDVKRVERREYWLLLGIEGVILSW